MSNLLSRPGVGCLSGEEASELLQEYLNTGAEMVLSVHPTAGMQKQPQGTGAGDQLIKPR